MNSYNFSSDPTSSFFVKETTSDGNTVIMDDIADSILQLNSSNEINQSVTEEGRACDIGDSKIDSECKASDDDDDANVHSNNVFDVTVDDGNNTSTENGKTSDFSVGSPDNVQDLVTGCGMKNDSHDGLPDGCSVEIISTSVDDNQDEKQFSIGITKISVEDDERQSSVCKVETVLSSAIDASRIETVSEFNEAENNENEISDSSVDKFDMEDFLSFKIDKSQVGATAACDKNDKRNAIIRKYFTECGSNSVKCNLCSDVLLSNLPNLVLHLRHVHKNDKSELIGKVWKYFTKVDAFKAKCSICSNLFVFRNRISVLVKHLRVSHKINMESDFKSVKDLMKTEDDRTSDENSPTVSPSSDVIVIKNSDGKLINQIKVNKSWKCFTKLPNSDKMICNLCKKIFTHNKTNDLLQHLHEEHKSLLSIKQQMFQESFLIKSENSSNEEDSNKSLTTEVAKSVIISKLSKHSNRLGKSVKSSKIWEYFAQLNDDKIKCNLCDKVLANNYSTSNLLRHLNARHTEAYNIIKELSASDTNAIKIVIQNEKGEPEKDVSVADMLADYENMLIPDEIVSVGELKTSMKIKQPMSETWKYYTKLKILGKVKCNLCKIMLSYTEGISSNLTRHLKLKHKEVFDKQVDIKQELVDEEDGQKNKRKKSVTVSEMLSKRSKFDVDKKCEDAMSKLKPGPKSKKMNKLKMIGETAAIFESTSDNIPTSITEFKLDTPESCNEADDGSELNNFNIPTEEKIQDNRQRSKAWDYFKRIASDNKVVCNICSQEISFAKSSTYKLFRHLAIKHNITFKRQPKSRKIFAYESDTTDEEFTKYESEGSKFNALTNAKSAGILSGDDNESNESTQREVVKRSEVKVTGRTWKHFTKLDRDKAKCNICGKVFTYKLGQTSNLIKHIQLKHKEVDSKSSSVKSGKEIKEDCQNDSVNQTASAVEMIENSESIVWKYFTKLEDSKAMCNLCEFPNILSYSDKSNSNLVKHLNRKHKNILKISGDYNLFIQTPDISYFKKYDSSFESKTSDDSIAANDSLGVVEHDDVQDMKSLFEYLITDEKLKRCIKYQDDQIKCRICSGSFVCENLINYEYTIRYHVQLFHAEWTVMCFDESLIKRECVSPVSDHDVLETHHSLEVPEPSYNELEAIANEVNSFMDIQDRSQKLLDQANNDKIVSGTSNNKTDGKTLSDDIWKYFTKLTSQNVRCNFCSILLSFRQHKKWNLIRHLKLKHKSKLNISIYKKSLNIKKFKKSKSLSNNNNKTLQNSSCLKSNKSLKKSKFKKVISNSSPTKKIKSDPETVEEMLSETDKNDNPATVKKNNSSPMKPLKKIKLKVDLEEQKQVSIASFNSPINRKIGRTWSHFTKIEMGKAQCNICNKILLYRGTGIDLLNDHLTGEHSSYFDGSSNFEPHKSFHKKIHFDSDGSISSEEHNVEDKECNSSVLKADDVKNDEDSKKSTSRVWQYFTKAENGYATCQLCLSEISFRVTTSNLMRHLQKIHSVISLLTPDTKTPDVTETEQSKLLAAVDLTPTRSQDKNHICFIRLNKNMVRCNFCPRVLYHKSGNMHKLMSHMLYKHRQETKKYKSLKNMRFFDNGNEVIMIVNDKRERPSQLPDVSSEQKIDKRKIYRSNTWLYFTKLNEHYAKCNICFNAFSYKGGSIYNLTRHLLIKHDVKLIKRYEIPYKKCPSLINLPTPKSTSISRKKSETLLFYKRISRYVVRCKLCMKRFIYKGINISRLINHLWSSHITKIIEIGGSHYSNVLKNIDTSLDIETESSIVKDCGTNNEEDVNIEFSGNIKDSNGTGRKSSSTWNYFTDLNDAERNVRCNICQKIFCFKSGNLSNLSRHLDKNHNIKKTSNHCSGQNCNVSDNVENVSSDEKKKLQQNYASENFNFSNCKEDNANNIDQNEIYVFFLKMNNSDNEVQCKFCSDVLQRDNFKNLKMHLSVKHDIHDFLSPKGGEKPVEELASDALQSENGARQKSNPVATKTNTISRMKCKLCYKEFISREGDFLTYLIEHLMVFHEQNLKDNEKHVLQGFSKEDFNSKINIDGCNAIEHGNNDKEEASVKSRLNLENTVLNYFKNLKSFKNKCKICYKYISAKRPCYHHVTNDITLRYSIRRSKHKDCDTKSERKINNIDNEETKSQAMSLYSKEKFNFRNMKIKHFMSVNLNDNKCYDCMASRNFGYCIHSLNLWLMNENKKKFDSAKLNSEFNNQLSLNTDEVQIIADSLNGCSENNIIIITDNDDTSVLNYNDITSRNESGTQDISYHIMNSINDIDDDDIKVIIYKYNSEEGTENEITQENGGSVKIREIAENPTADNIPSSSHKVLDEHISNIVNELNDTSQLIYNSESNAENNGNLVKEKNETENSALQMVEQTKNQASENLNAHDVSVVENNQLETEVVSESEVMYQRSFDLEKLTELAEVSCNEQFYKRNSLLNFAEQPVTIEDVPYSESVNVQQVKTKVSSVGSDRCIVENIYPEDHGVDGSIAVEKEYVTRSDVVYKDEDVESSVVVSQSQTDYIESAVVDGSHNNSTHGMKETIEQAQGVIDSNDKHNEVISEDVINAIFNEVIVNLQENPDVKELNLIKLNNDDIEIPSGLYLQNLKGIFKINKIVLFFSNINYKYKTAKCNLCKMYLEFAEPVIYNLLMHLFTHHKDKVCTEEPINKVLVDDDMALDSINKPRRKSPVWKYFVNEKNFRAICKICRFSFSYKGGAINNLSRHLRLRHNIIVSSKSSDDPNYDVGYMLSYPKRRSAVKLRSKTWNYFSKEPNDWAKCRICNKYLSYRSSTINNLTRHLRTIHSKIFNSLFTDKDPIFIKNEDGSLSENINFINNDENCDIYNSLLMETSNTKSRDEILQQCSYSSMENNNRRKSIVWNYFTEITPNCGKCNFCSKVISCKGGGTSNLSRHLRSRHGIWIVLTSNLSQTFNETMNHPESNQNATDSLNSIGNTEANDTIITQEQLHILKNRKLIHKKSKTWEYFTKESADRVRCNLCSKPLSYKCKAVHNLRRHLAKKHPSCIVKPDPVRLKLQINTENDVLHNSNDVHDTMITEANKKFIDITDTSVVIVDEETQLPPHRPDRNSRPKKSIVWNYFEELEYGIAKCLICSKILSFRGGGTNNLMRHLRCRHAIIIVNQTIDSIDKEPVVIAGCDNNEDSDTINLVNMEQEESNIVVSDANIIQNA